MDFLKVGDYVDLMGQGLAEVPKYLTSIAGLRFLELSRNHLTALPQDFGQLTKLVKLYLSNNELIQIPDSISKLQDLWMLDLSHNKLSALPKSFGQLNGLYKVNLSNNKLTSLPNSIGQMTNLRELDLSFNQLTQLPVSLGRLTQLDHLNLEGNRLNPELLAASQEGLTALLRYLRAQAEAHVALYEAKLILVGEGEVGKSCLLGALKGDEWEEGRPSTHGIEIKSFRVTDPNSNQEITLNGWDFGGQRVYRPTHQLFFSAPAIYLVVWKPREGSQQGLVKEWIKLIQHREPEAKIIVVATHGGPGQRQPDIDKQELWDCFGREMICEFLFVDSKPDAKGKRREIPELKYAIANIAAALPEMGRKIPARWQQTREVLLNSNTPYLKFQQVLEFCLQHKMELEEARDFIRISHRLGHLLHYEHDVVLRDVVILKPNWLATAISFVLDDAQTRLSHGLISFKRLGQLWNNATRDHDERYSPQLHPVFLRLMERFDISYRIAEPGEGQIGTTSLIAQLVPDVRPDVIPKWTTSKSAGDVQQVQICRIVDAKKGKPATAEGLFFQLIVRLHKYSMGRLDYRESVHWQRGLLLDNDYNGRALLEYIDNDIRITVRAAYPERFLSVLTDEVKWLVERFWSGLHCEVMVPCIDPCGKNAAGTGLFEVKKLIESKRNMRSDYPCPVCDEWRNIDSLLRNAPVAQAEASAELLTSYSFIKRELIGIREELVAQRSDAIGRFDRLDMNTQRILSKVDEAFTRLMKSLTDEAKEGPRLFSFQPVEPKILDRPSWFSTKFKLTLWCEHSRMPLPALNGKDDQSGVYDLVLSRDWLVKAAPFLKVLTSTLSLVLPVASSVTKLVLDDGSTFYRHFEKELDLSQKSVEAAIKAEEEILGRLTKQESPDLKVSESRRADGAALRQLHAWLRQKDPGFGGLTRVQNRRQEFLWVHKKFENEY